MSATCPSTVSFKLVPLVPLPDPPTGTLVARCALTVGHGNPLHRATVGDREWTWEDSVAEGWADASEGWQPPPAEQEVTD